MITKRELFIEHFANCLTIYHLHLQREQIFFFCIRLQPLPESWGLCHHEVHDTRRPARQPNMIHVSLVNLNDCI